MVTKFCIITTQRSGSTWLRQLLNSHPQVRTLGEAFLWRKNKPIWDKEQPDVINFYDFDVSNDYVRPWVVFKYLNLLESHIASNQAFGFKLMYNQIVARPEILLKLVWNNYKIIHLVRNNYLDVIVSRTRLKESGLAHSSKPIDFQPVNLDATSLPRKLHKHEMTIVLFKNALKLLPCQVLDVNYEDLCINKGETLSEITKFLIVDNHENFHSSLHKLSKKSTKDNIANYEEVKSRLSETKFSKLLVD